MKDHNHRDCKPHLFKHSIENRHDPVQKNDVRTIGKGYKNTRGQKIAEK